MTKPKDASKLGRRERQIMDVIHRLGRASVSEVREALPDPPTYSSVRGMLGLLEEKGHLRHEADRLKYVYFATVGRSAARRSALRHVVHTFFGGSASEAAASLLEMSDTPLTAEDVTRLAAIIRDAKREGR